MYCNSCLKQIPNDVIVYCTECGVPLHSTCANHCLVCGAPLCDDCYQESRFKCSNCMNDDKEIKSIRRSFIKQYEDCPYSLYLQLIEGIVPPMSSYAEVGIITHDIIEKMQHGKTDLNHGKAELLSRIQEWNVSTEDEYSLIPEQMNKIGIHSLEVFSELMNYLKGDFKTEYKIEYSLDENLPTVNCTLDRISIIGDKIHIHDWKTGKPMSGKQLVNDLQPPVYIYGVYKEFGKLPDKFTLHYLNAEKNITYVHTGDMIYEVKTARNKYTLDVKAAIERVKNILSNIKKNKFEIIEDKEHMWRCDKMCWFHSSGMCDNSVNAEWKLINKKRAAV